MADTASTLLPISNPINVLIVGHMRLPLAAYAQHVLPAAVGVTLINAAVLDHGPCPVLLVRGATPLPGRSNRG